MMLVRQRSHDRVMCWRGFQWFLGQNSSLKAGRNGLHGKDAATPLHRRAWRVYVHFLAVSVACTKQVS
jgi:hypothetical protein